METLASINELFPSSAPVGPGSKNTVEELGSEDFLTLMVAQLKNQDPTKPMDNMQFMGQLAQFSTVAGIQEMQEGFSDLAASMTANQTVQAAGLVGRDVVTEGNVGNLVNYTNAEGESISLLNATIDFGGSTSGGQIYIQDLQGRLVYSADLPASTSSTMPVQWNGLDSSGNALPPGSYRVSAEATIGGQNQSVSVYAHQRVVSVAIDQVTGGVSLNLENGQSVAVNAVKEFL